MQGPLAGPPGDDDGEGGGEGGRRYLRIEPFGGPGPADGYVALSSRGGPNDDGVRLDFGMVPGSGSALLPRFGFESDDDRAVLDGLVRRSGRCDVESVTVAATSAGGAGSSTAGAGGSEPAGLVGDPLDPSMVHVVRPGWGVATVTTDAVYRANDSLRARLEGAPGRGGDGTRTGSAGAARTKVWSCLEAGGGSGGGERQRRRAPGPRPRGEAARR